MGLKFMVLLAVVVFIGGYMRGYSDSPGQVIVKNITVTRTVTEQAKCEEIKINVVNVSRITPQLETVRVTINTTARDLKQILNLKPTCEGVGCNYGFILGKYACMDVLGLQHPKFSEKPPSGGMELFNPQNASQCLPVQDDGFGKYIRLNQTMWQLYQGYDPPSQRKISLKCKDNSTIEYKVWTMENRTDRDIYLRRV